MTDPTDFERALEVILQKEAGYWVDPGAGPTNLGVTVRSWSDWVGHEATAEEIRALSGATVAPFYEAKYWQLAACDQAPHGLDLMLFDCAVNQGPGTAVKFVQTVLGLDVDGHVGPLTKQAIMTCDVGKTIDAVAERRKAKYQQSAGFDHFGNGWFNRVDEITKLSHQWAGTGA
jgi:lysozyme family protein